MVIGIVLEFVLCCNDSVCVGGIFCFIFSEDKSGSLECEGKGFGIGAMILKLKYFNSQTKCISFLIYFSSVIFPVNTLTADIACNKIQ